MISAEKKEELIERLSKINKTILKNVCSNLRRIKGEKRKEDLIKKDKIELAKEIVDSVLDKNLLLKFWESLTEDERKVLYATLWFFKKFSLNNYRDIERLKERVNIADSEGNFFLWLDSLFSKHRIRWIFRIDEKHCYEWDPILREIFEQILERPEGLELRPVSNVEEGLIIHNAEEEILRNIKGYTEWAKEYSSRKWKDMFSVIKIRLSRSEVMEWKEDFGIDEFFPELEGCEFIKSEILMRFFLYTSHLLHVSKEFNPKKKDPISILKDVIKFFPPLFYFYRNPLSQIILFYLIPYPSDPFDSEIKNPYSFYESFLDLLKELNSGEWFEINQLISYAKERDIFPDANEHFWDCSTILIGRKKKEIGLESEEDRELIEKYIEIPLFKGLFFLFSSLGILDIAYREPSLNDFSSPYDGLSFVRLTPLGEYLFGKRKEYSFSERIEECNIFADPNYTVLKVKGIDPVLKGKISRISEQRGKNIFLITPDSIIKASDDPFKLKENMNFLKSLLPSPIPSVWEQLFEELRERENLLRMDNDQYIMIKVNLDSSLDQIKKILEDDIISKYTIKANGGRIFVKKRHFSHVKRRLKELGFLI